MNKVKLNNLQNTFDESVDYAESLIHFVVEEPSKYVFLGNGLAFPAALYGSLKMNEVFGKATSAYNLDDYCHSPIFGIKSNDMIIIMANNEDDVRVSKVIKNRLIRHNVSVFYITSTRQNIVKKILKFIFFSQLYPAKLAMKNGLKDCYFLKNSDLLRLSSKLIYT
jgi:glucosamine 6-phosphate synthetase-like amidotransferase/phosphosugar isomerase protein